MLILSKSFLSLEKNPNGRDQIQLSKSLFLGLACVALCFIVLFEWTMIQVPMCGVVRNKSEASVMCQMIYLHSAICVHACVSACRTEVNLLTAV